jgi:hypothetical protein
MMANKKTIKHDGHWSGWQILMADKNNIGRGGILPYVFDQHAYGSAGLLEHQEQRYDKD